MSGKLRTTLPAFIPVPRQTRKVNGWAPEVQQAFIEALADLGSVRAACRAVNRSDNGAYQLRRHPEARSFRKAWNAALDIAVLRLEDEAMHRALHGTEEQHTYHDRVVVRRRFNDRLLMFLLRHRAPHRFSEGGARGLSALDKMTLRRLKKQWRKEWEAEPPRWARRSPEEIRESILEKLEAIERARREQETPRERELREALAAETARREAREEAEYAARFERDNPGREYHPPSRWGAAPVLPAPDDEDGDDA